MIEERNTLSRTTAPGRIRRLRLAIFSIAATVLTFLMLFYLIFVPFGTEFAKDFARDRLAAYFDRGDVGVDFDDLDIQLTGRLVPELRINNVVITEAHSGGQLTAETIVISWHFPSVFTGKPAMQARIFGPVVQLVQDFDGIHLARFEIDGESDGKPLLRLPQGQRDAADIRLTHGGLITGADARPASARIRSDNDWIIDGVETIERLLAHFSRGTNGTGFRHLGVSDAKVEIIDRIYQLYRQIDQFDARLEPSGEQVKMDFSFRAGNRNTSGEMVWSANERGMRYIDGRFQDIDLALLLPFVDDQDGILALKGGTQLSLALEFSSDGVSHGEFEIDINAAQASVNGDLLDIEAERARLVWFPDEARYVLAPFELKVGQSSAGIEGEFKLGLDQSFGPTLGYSINLTNVALHPYDMGAPNDLIDVIAVTGWSAPLYGATGIDALTIRDDRFELDGHGRVDVVQRGRGIELVLFGKGASADDIKRLWPDFLATAGRNWFIENVTAGVIDEARMHIKFPVGTIGDPGDSRPIPEGGVFIEATASDVSLVPLPGFPDFPGIQIDGTTEISIDDYDVEAGFDKAVIRDRSGEVAIENAAYLNRDVGATEQLFELSGGVKGSLATLLAIVDREPINLLRDFDIHYTPEDLRGDAEVQVIATISQGKSGQLKGVDYSLNGTIEKLSSKKPIAGYGIANGTANFTASQEGYRISAQADIDGVEAAVLAEVERDQEPVITFSAALSEEDRKAIGLNIEQFVEGSIRVVARPVGEHIQVAVDLTDARLKFTELGIDKPPGVEGQLKANLVVDAPRIEATVIDLRFADVKLLGSLVYDMETGLQSADIDDLVLNEGDRAGVYLRPIEGGYSVQVVGEQLDLKPVLKRFLGLGGESSTQATSNVENQIIDISVNLNRALGFYKTTAYDMNAHLIFRGADFTRVDLQASLGNTRVVSVATNPVQEGRHMSAATNDLGTLLRFIGMYSRLLGGEASLALSINTVEKLNSGEFSVKEFSLVNEDKVAQVLGNHKDSRTLIERENRLNFRKAYVRFNRRGEMIKVEDATLDGGSIGGTMRGGINTDSRQYDLVGTYIPLFGLNNIFQKLPLFGRLLGGRDGEGLIGVTFAIRGPLDNPAFVINPAAILVPGVFRQIFEFRARGGDTEAQKALESADAE